MNRIQRRFYTLIVFSVLAVGGNASAETGYDAWLRYAPLSERDARRYDDLPANVVTLEDSVVIQSAEKELVRGIRGMLGQTLRMESELPDEDSIIIGTLKSVKTALPSLDDAPELSEDGYWLTTIRINGNRHTVIAGPTDSGALYGTFAYLRKIALLESVSRVNEESNPYAPIRFLNHWENLDGSIERGYGGRSIFWENDELTDNLGRIEDYARLMASLGINGCSINNVNADFRVITLEYFDEVTTISEIFQRWGVKTLISLDFASPRRIGNIETFDPLDPAAVEFWKNKMDEVYANVPNIGGFVLKADSEGRLGPSEYGRTHADAANVIARAIQPYGGVLFYRGFVYNHRMDWTDLSLDRAKAAYDNFQPLDGDFEDNVIIQIKHGPIDFQVREPASPLFGALENTSQAIELQITQEYLGQQLHLCYVVPMWKEVLDFDMQARGPGTPVKELISGKTFNRPNSGFVGVSNVGRDTNWLGHQLAMANLYGFGKLAWNPDDSSEDIAEEWTRLTFGHDRKVVDTIVDLQMDSWPAYEKYSGNLGIGTLCDILGYHFGPGPESSEHNGWGQWHRSVESGTGMYRTRSGTGYVDQYSKPIADMYNSLETCPDELLLFFHHVPYTHKLKNGKTVIQHFYDEHYEGVEIATGFIDRWKSLEGLVDEQRFNETLDRFEFQAGHAVVWRESVNNWFHKTSGIPDDKGRVGNHPNRFEAENFELTGYEVVDIEPFESASGEQAVQLTDDDRVGSVAMIHNGEAGWHDIVVQYYDENDGAASYRLFVNDQLVDEWVADFGVAHRLANGHSSTRNTTKKISLRPGDRIRIDTTKDADEPATIDYFEVRLSE